MKFNKRHRIIHLTITTCIIATMLVSTTLLSLFMYTNINNNILKPLLAKQELTKSIDQLQYVVTTLSDSKSQLTTDIKSLEDYTNECETGIKELQTIEIDKFARYNSLYTKYKYVLDYNKKNANSDFGLKELLYQDNISSKCSAPTALMLAIYEKESSFNSRAKNPTSTATGYGQLIDSSAKMVNDKFLRRPSYDRSKHRELAINKQLNMDLATAYISRNIEVYKTPRAALVAYYGSTSASDNAAYANDINQRLKHYGYTLENVCEKE